MIKALKNTLTKNRRLKIGSLKKMDDYFTISLPRNVEIFAPISLGFVLVWNKHVFSRSKMTVFQIYNKKYGIKNVAIWVEILQLHRYIITVITWRYLKKKKENFRNIEKKRENKYTCSFCFTQAFLLVLAPEYDGVSWKHRLCYPWRIKKPLC